MKNLTPLAVTALVVGLTLSPGHPAAACGDGEAPAAEGHYTGQGTFGITATGQISEAAVVPLSFNAPLNLDFQVSGVGGVNGRLTTPPVAVSIVVKMPEFGGTSSRTEQMDADLTGNAKRGGQLRGGDQITLQVLEVKCGRMGGTVDSNQGLPRQLAEMYRAQGLTVQFVGMTWEARPDGADDALEARVDEMIARLKSVRRALDDSQFVPVMQEGLNLGQSLAPPEGQRDPYRDCLVERLLNALGELAMQRVRERIAQFDTPPGPGIVLRPSYLGQLLADMRLALSFGCDVNEGWEAARQFLRRLFERRSGDPNASGRDLLDVMRMMEMLGGEGEDFVTRMEEAVNQRSRAAGLGDVFPQ